MLLISWYGEKFAMAICQCIFPYQKSSVKIVHRQTSHLKSHFENVSTIGKHTVLNYKKYIIYFMPIFVGATYGCTNDGPKCSSRSRRGGRSARKSFGGHSKHCSFGANCRPDARVPGNYLCYPCFYIFL